MLLLAPWCTGVSGGPAGFESCFAATVSICLSSQVGIMSLIQTKEHGICVDSIAPKSQGIFDHGMYEEAGMDDSLLVPVLAANPGVGPLRTERVAASPCRGAENAKDKSKNRVDDGRQDKRERRDESGRADALALAGNRWNAVDPSL